ncbi:DNA-binding domain-containing protein [Enterovibrio sp. ZSDZ42]|uniref:DNA-binding domain-containing protein n=1 Tax=Enterovibrio gelatinilyticus TaxID=2899819 RepID=A0ABT5R036_9GAMM|nr:DNA-binding domain-containing protein [Enterovibrio sp. ZSDZ42]MDD1793210.1 DNA-binding domain-containing protein [Enterovibrio sp. ZSDZ42]
MKLQEIQDQFQSIVLNETCRDANWVNQSAQRLSSKDRLAIYHNAYRVRLIDVLRDTFGHTVTYLGDDWFNQLAADYVQSHHSCYNNIGFYGDVFPEFLAQQLPDDLEVSELAALDWTLRRAFDGADSPVMTLEDLQGIASAESQDGTLKTVPTLSVTTHHFNTLDIWHAIDQDVAPPEVAPLPQQINVLVWRKGHSPHFRSISSIESAAIGYVSSGMNLNDLGAKLSAQFPDTDMSVEFGQMLLRWINDEVLAI